MSQESFHKGIGTRNRLNLQVTLRLLRLSYLPHFLGKRQGSNERKADFTLVIVFPANWRYPRVVLTADCGGCGRDDRRGLRWPVKAILIFVALLCGFFEHALGGWAGPICMALAAVVVPVFLLRKFWNGKWFWITAAALALVQIPLVVKIRPLIEQQGSLTLLTFVMADGLFVIVVLSLVHPTSTRSHT